MLHICSCQMYSADDGCDDLPFLQLVYARCLTRAPIFALGADYGCDECLTRVLFMQFSEGMSEAQGWNGEAVLLPWISVHNVDGVGGGYAGEPPPFDGTC